MTEWFSKHVVRPTTELEIRGKHIPEVIVQVLETRGYDTPEKIEKYFAPSLRDLHDPFLMPDMEKSVDRISEAMINHERILIHGDYDTDGITGTALIVSVLARLGIDVIYYIPHRLTEGYGLSLAGINHALQQGCTLCITVDCGITAHSEILHARTQGLDVIICDHHKPEPVLPSSYAILNPKIPSTYPFTDLAGVGVAFKMLHALYTKLKRPVEELYDDLDLVALGSVVDIVPLIDENRILVKYGMKRITKSAKPGFQALLEETGLKGGLTAYHLGFIIGPRINACGRLRDAQEALELFLTDDTRTALSFARALSEDNRKRQEIEEAMYKEATSLIEQHDYTRDRVIVLSKEGWHEGVVGIVASRISEDYYKPSILLALQKERAKGSARSVPGFDIAHALSSCRDILKKFGGHSQAAGLELERKRLDELHERMNGYAQQCDAQIFEKKRMYDVELSLDKITDEVIYFLKFFEPTGMANPQPVFLGKGFEVVGIPRVVGSNHLRFALRNNNRTFDAIAYGQADSILDIEVGKTTLDCLYSIAEDSFYGKQKVMLKVKEMKRKN